MQSILCMCKLAIVGHAINCSHIVRAQPAHTAMKLPRHPPPATDASTIVNQCQSAHPRVMCDGSSPGRFSHCSPASARSVNVRNSPVFLTSARCYRNVDCRAKCSLERAGTNAHQTRDVRYGTLCWLLIGRRNQISETYFRLSRQMKRADNGVLVPGQI